MRRATHCLRMLALALLMACAPALAGAQTVGVGPVLLRDGSLDFPGGPGVTVQGEWVWGGLLGVRVVGGRMWGRETRPGTLCTGLIPPNAICPVEPVEHRNTLTALEALGLMYTERFVGLRLGFGAGFGAYDVQVSRYGEDSERELKPVTLDGVAPISPTLLAKVDVHPSFAGALGLEAAVQTSWIRFENCVTDAWALCSTEGFTRLSLAATYAIR